MSEANKIEKIKVDGVVYDIGGSGGGSEGAGNSYVIYPIELFEKLREKTITEHIDDPEFDEADFNNSYFPFTPVFSINPEALQNIFTTRNISLEDIDIPTGTFLGIFFINQGSFYEGLNSGNVLPLLTIRTVQESGPELEEGGGVRSVVKGVFPENFSTYTETFNRGNGEYYIYYENQTTDLASIMSNLEFSEQFSIDSNWGNPISDMDDYGSSEYFAVIAVGQVDEGSSPKSMDRPWTPIFENEFYKAMLTLNEVVSLLDFQDFDNPFPPEEEALLE